MLQIHDGQCGLCVHFGQEHEKEPQFVQMRTKHAAPESLVERCDHPKNIKLHLKVTPISGCDGFTPANHN